MFTLDDIMGVVGTLHDAPREDTPHQRFHDLRHCCATLLLAPSVSARVVRDVLGHSQVSLTLGTYSHIMPTMLHEAAEAVGCALG